VLKTSLLIFILLTSGCSRLSAGLTAFGNSESEPDPEWRPDAQQGSGRQVVDNNGNVIGRTR
jgi:hypothetical protein